MSASEFRFLPEMRVSDRLKCILAACLQEKTADRDQVFLALIENSDLPDTSHESVLEGLNQRELGENTIEVLGLIWDGTRVEGVPFTRINDVIEFLAKSSFDTLREMAYEEFIESIKERGQRSERKGTDRATIGTALYRAILATNGSSFEIYSSFCWYLARDEQRLGTWKSAEDKE